MVEENRRVDVVKLSGCDENTLLFFLKSSRPGSESQRIARQNADALGPAHRRAARPRPGAGATKEITDDQTRLRANFEKVPPTSAAYKRYLEKFDAQETEIEKLQALIKAKQATEKAQAKELEDYIAALNVE